MLPSRATPSGATTGKHPASSNPSTTSGPHLFDLTDEPQRLTPNRRRRARDQGRTVLAADPDRPDPQGAQRPHQGLIDGRAEHELDDAERGGPGYPKPRHPLLHYPPLLERGIDHRPPAVDQDDPVPLPAESDAVGQDGVAIEAAHRVAAVFHEENHPGQAPALA